MINHILGLLFIKILGYPSIHYKCLIFSIDGCVLCWISLQLGITQVESLGGSGQCYRCMGHWLDGQDLPT